MRNIIMMSLFLLLVITPITSFSCYNSSIPRQMYNFLVIGNWNSIPYPHSLSSISVNVIYYINQSLVNAYALKINIILPRGLLNTSSGDEIIRIFPLNNFQVSGNYLFSFNVTVSSTTLSKNLLFDTIITLYTTCGDITYTTNFTLPYYGYPKFNITILNRELNLGYNNVTFLISNNNGTTLYNVTIESPYLLTPAEIPILKQNQSIEVYSIAYIPYLQHLVDEIPITVYYLTEYGFVNKSDFNIPLYFNISSLPYATIKVVNSLSNALSPGLNMLNFTLVNPSNTTLNNLTLIVYYGNAVHVYDLGNFPRFSSRTFTLIAFANSSQVVKVYGTFMSPLGIENLSLGTFNVPLISEGPFLLEFSNNSLSITNQINLTVTNITVTFFNGYHVSIPLLLPHQTRVIETNIETSLVNITYKINNITLYSVEKVQIMPYVKFNVYYAINNVTHVSTGDSGYLVLYISNEGNTLVTNVFIVVSYPNGTRVTPDFYLISQIFPNETIAVPFSIYTQTNAIFHIKIIYYVMNKSYTVIYDVPVNFNYVHRPLPASFLGIIGYYITYPIFGIPAIILVVLVIFLVIILIPSRGFRRRKENEE